MTLLGKAFAILLAVVAIGPPLLETWEALLLLAALLAVAAGSPILTWRRAAFAVAVVLVAAAVRGALPRADIAEAHQALLLQNDGGALERAIPPAIFRSWKAQFEARYPPSAERAQVGTWRTAVMPKTAVARSADAIWRRSEYSRQVDRIEFRTLAEFRGGFANDPELNFWTGDLLRERMPFYVMYRLTPASAGSELAWKGQLFWERADGGFDEIVHAEPAARTITASDAGRRVYAAFFPQGTPATGEEEGIYLALRPSFTLRAAGWVESLVTMIAVIAVIGLLVRVAAGPWLRAAALVFAAYGVMTAFLAVSAGKYLGAQYPPQGGGDDGMVHDGWGHAMALLSGDGRVIEALQGFEPVYWFTPGTRYVRMVEKLIFGDTNHLFALVVSCLPLIIFLLLRRFMSAWRAGAVAAVVLLLPAGKLSFLQYVSNAKLGYGEAIAGACFMGALLLMFRAVPGWGGSRNPALVWCAGAALALSMFVRPNFAFAVVWLGAACVWALLRQRDAASIAALVCGLGLALWLPFHNWYYGDAFFLISRSGATVSVPLTPADYVSAAREAFAGRMDAPIVGTATAQLRGWLWEPGYMSREVLAPLAWTTHGIALFALAWTGWAAVRRTGDAAPRRALRVIAVTALLAHLPMLFIFSTHFRYAMLGWDLVVLVLLISLLGHRVARSRPAPALEAAH